jgi:isopenicillin-N N-acyltransferase-like protein
VETGRAFPRHRFEGTHREIGRQYGEACADLILRHRDLALRRLDGHARLAPGQAVEEALRYRPFVVNHARFLDEEIGGVSEGAGITLGEAYLLQLRAELFGPDPSSGVNSECTTFALLPEATAGGEPLIGQNADLPRSYTELGVVAEMVPDDSPATLMLVPAGQVSYIGINDRGLGVFANFLTCTGWRLGFPRYLLTRLALLHGTVQEAIDAVRRVPRASSRNLIMADAQGGAADLETTPTETARLEPEDGILVHSNHFVGQDLLGREALPAPLLEDSRARLRRIRELLEARRGDLDVPELQDVFRDREGLPYPLCRAPGDDGSGVITFASVIAEPAREALRVAVGPPHENPYRRHNFSRHNGERETDGR